MITGHRYRVLFYFAALVLCLSVCFAYAETPSSKVDVSAEGASASATHILFYATPGRSSFMPGLTSSFIALPAAMPPTPSADNVMHQLTAGSNRGHGGVLRALFPSKKKLHLVNARAPEHLSAASSVLTINQENATETR